VSRLRSSLALGLLVVGGYATSLRPAIGGSEGSAALRLLGPISSLAAGWQWVRVRMALYDGKPDLAYARAELALELDPEATDGWSYLASTMAFDRASPYRQRNPLLRTRWTEVALEVLERGEASAAQPAELAVQRGLTLVFVGNSEGAVPWEGGAAGAWGDAQRAFERATELDPGYAEGWAQRAANRVLRLGGPTLVPDPEGRLLAFREGLALLDRGRAVARFPELLDFQRGALLTLLAESGDGALWPGGPEALYDEALVAYARAEASDFPLARVAAESARDALAELADR